MGFPGDSEVKASACNAGDPGSIPGLGRSAGEGIGYPAGDQPQLIQGIRRRDGLGDYLYAN